MERGVPLSKYMFAADVTVAVFKHITQPSVSGDIVTDTSKGSRRARCDYGSIMAWVCGEIAFFKLHYGRKSVDQWVSKGREKVQVCLQGLHWFQEEEAIVLITVSHGSDRTIRQLLFFLLQASLTQRLMHEYET